MSSNLVSNQLAQEEFSQNDLRNSRRNKSMPLLQWWYHFSSPTDATENASFLAREQVRRGRVASLIILGILCAAVLLVPIILLAVPGMLVLPWAFTSTGVGILCCMCALPLNRRRHVQLAGILLLVAVDVIVAGIVLSERAGLDPLFLSMFDLLVLSELIAASLLAPISVFGVALINSILIIIDINLQPRSMMWMQMVLSPQLAYSLLARPITLYVVVAAVAYLWVNSALNALQRADRAELIAELERRENEQKQRLEQEIEQILLTHVRVANGDLNARAPAYQDTALWQINIALNNLLSRFKSALRAERNLRALAEEVTQLRVALRNWKPGQPLQWYPSTEMLLNPLVDDLRRVLKVESAQRAFPLSTPVTPIPLSTPVTPFPLSTPVTPLPLQERQSGRLPTPPRSPGKNGFSSNQDVRPQDTEILPYNTLDRSGNF